MRTIELNGAILIAMLAGALPRQARGCEQEPIPTLHRNIHRENL
jgi:hypothetical protein